MVEDKSLYTVLPYKRLNNNHLNIRSGRYSIILGTINAAY